MSLRWKNDQILIKNHTKINTVYQAYFLLSEFILKSELLNEILEEKRVDKQKIIEIYERAKNDPTELFEAAKVLRMKKKGNVVTFSKKVFFNVINLCKDTCAYCTYKAEPWENKLSLMSKQSINQLLDIAKKHRCVEALFVTGERPEEKYSEAKKWLRENGFSSTAEYLTYCSETALSKGLFPHTNAGNLTKDELKELKKTNTSLGLMLENSSERLTKKGMPHYLADSKKPKKRLKVLENAGHLGIPMTTGILVGIGETPYEIIDSIFAIKNIHEKYHNIQEIIIQNFQPKPDTIMYNHRSPAETYFKSIVALARIILPNMNIQIPPNLSPRSYQSFLSTGINDWGGISPITPDFVNPEFAWPSIQEVEKNTNKAGFKLKCRFPIYPEFIFMLNKELKQKMDLIKNEDGLVKETYWRSPCN